MMENCGTMAKGQDISVDGHNRPRYLERCGSAGEIIISKSEHWARHCLIDTWRHTLPYIDISVISKIVSLVKRPPAVHARFIGSKAMILLSFFREEPPLTVMNGCQRFELNQSERDNQQSHRIS